MNDDSLRAARAHAQMLWRRGNLETAADYLTRQTDAVDGDDVWVLRLMLGDVNLELGRYRAALNAYVGVLADEPNNLAALQGLSWCLARRPQLVLLMPSWEPIAAALEHPDVDPDLVAQGGWALLRTVHAPLDHRLLLPLLRQAIVTDEAIEQALTEARKQLCLAPAPRPTALALALAAQGQLNEFVWSVSPQEAAALADSPPWVQAMYAASDSAVEPIRRADHAGNPPVEPVEPVRAMYEENPYPRWHRITRRTPGNLARHLTRLSEGRYRPQAGYTGRMLVAGCGTGREMISAALAWQPESLTGFDLSGTSLTYAGQMADKFGVSVKLHQTDLLHLAAADLAPADDPGAGDGQYDVIICTGVLHHLADPLAGWRVLRDRLRPGGVMLVGLYSQTAREQITSAQEEVRNFPRTIAGIRAAREHLRALPAEHPARGGMILRDFYYTSGCRDLLMHVQEHQFTITGIADSLIALDLRFLGFEVDPAVIVLHKTLFPRGNELPSWEQFERLYPHTFLGMYQFWVQRPIYDTVDAERVELNPHNLEVSYDQQ